MSTCAPPRSFVRMKSEPAAEPPPARREPLWRELFGSFASAMISVAIGGIALTAVPRLLSWAVVHGVWSGDGATCAAVGACWAFLREKAPFILFGIYPPAERWRPAVAVVLLILLALWSLPRSHWTRRTLALWGLGLLACLALMNGGLIGLTRVHPTAWGGLPVTLLLTVFSLGLGFPCAVVLALARRSRLPIVRWMSTALIEIVRGLPLLTILFIASIMLPLMLPQNWSIDPFTRALAALTLFCAAYLAEVIRGGLQGVEAGQEEAARALGLSWLQTVRLIVLPQALHKVIPALTSTVVVVVKNTSLVFVVGLFDLLNASRAAAADPQWPAPYTESYLFIALIYFVICFAIARYARTLELSASSARSS